MGLRQFIDELEKEGKLIHISKEVNPNLEIAGILKENDGKTILFEKVRGSKYKVVAGICSSRENYAKDIGCNKDELLFKISNAIEKPTEPEVVTKGPCQEVVEKDVDLSQLPILTHTSKDFGPYITAGVWIAKDKDFGLNAAYHRASPISKNKLVARICHRDTYKFLQKQDPLPVAICIGLNPAVCLAAAISPPTGVSELSIANSLGPLKLVKCITSDILVPTDAEFVLEGKLTMKERNKEGPFPDITGTLDVVRDEPVVTIEKITHRKDAIYQGMLPAMSEHRLMMGMPREPTIYQEVKKVADCKNVLLTTGGCSWFHAVVQIAKKNPDDGKKAAEAAFKGHHSLKHCVVVDDDIDIHNLSEVEWAIATRFQAHKNANIFKGPGSSLDCTAECIEGSDRRETSKVGIDATIPWDKPREKFMKARPGE